MPSKSKIKQQAMKNAIRIWELKSGDQLDPSVKLLIEAFCELIYENENSIEDIRERLLHQIASALTPDSLVAARPAHSVMQAVPMEPVTVLNRRDIFYTDRMTNRAMKYGLKNVHFAPVTDNILLTKGEIQYLLCERNLYRIGSSGEKDLFARARTFNEGLNRCVYIGLSLDKHVETLKDVHFYFDFRTLEEKYELFDLLRHTRWSIEDRPIRMGVGLGAGEFPEKKDSESIFSHYNTLDLHDEELMDLYCKQFLHIRDNLRTASLKKTPFPEELVSFFPERVQESEDLLWLKVVFPPYFKSDDIDDLVVYLNVFPVSNKSLQRNTLDRSRSLTGILTLPVKTGEHFLAVHGVEDSDGNSYNFLPYTLAGTDRPQGTYTIKKGGLERFSTRDLADTVERMIDLYRSELVTFSALKMDNIRNLISDMEQTTVFIKELIDSNNSRLPEMPVYLLIDSEEETDYIYASYWTTHCELGNGFGYGTPFAPLHSLFLEKDSCRLLKTSKGGKSIPKNSEMLTAYRYAMTTRDQLYSIKDIENYCYMRLGDRILSVKVKRGIACSPNEKEGLIRVLDVQLVPHPEYRDFLRDPATRGELKIELEKRSPDIYNFRIIVEDTAHQH